VVNAGLLQIHLARYQFAAMCLAKFLWLTAAFARRVEENHEPLFSRQTTFLSDVTRCSAAHTMIQDPLNMADRDTEKLVEALNLKRETVLKAWRSKVRTLESAQAVDTPTLNDHIPALLDVISAALLEGRAKSMEQTSLKSSSTAHGMLRRWIGFDIVEVVAEYNAMRSVLHDLLEAHGLTLGPQRARIINDVIDQAIGLAVRSMPPNNSPNYSDIVRNVLPSLLRPQNAIICNPDGSVGSSSVKVLPPENADIFKGWFRSFAEMRSVWDLSSRRSPKKKPAIRPVLT
jgi:hypothetical protein